MEYFKLQLGCLIIVLYVTFIYSRERREYKIKKRDLMFSILACTGIVCILFDGITAYTVNHPEQVTVRMNQILHMCFLISLDLIAFMMFIYMMDITVGITRNRWIKALLMLPFLAGVLLGVGYTPRLHYVEGKVTNYSMGISVYTCFLMAFIYLVMALVMVIRSWRHLERHKQVSIFTYLVATAGVMFFQMLKPEALVTCLVPTIVVLGAYLNQENPLFTRLSIYHREMVMGFATLVEKRDNSTGGHIRRTTNYVEILAEELKNQGYYREELTEDYIKDLLMAAPMHDIGKIAIPDAILQKPGGLTDEEYEIMQSHAAHGGRIIQETFGHLGEDSYASMAYKVARYHHEKWDGTGYPEGLSGSQIPLCARIMAIADVFDAVSADRCYRKALPLSTCFQIIEDGSGKDFDPVMTTVFLRTRDKIAQVHDRTQDKTAIEHDNVLPE